MERRAFHNYRKAVGVVRKGKKGKKRKKQALSSRYKKRFPLDHTFLPFVVSQKIHTFPFKVAKSMVYGKKFPQGSLLNQKSGNKIDLKLKIDFTLYLNEKTKTKQKYDQTSSIL